MAKTITLLFFVLACSLFSQNSQIVQTKKGFANNGFRLQENYWEITPNPDSVLVGDTVIFTNTASAKQGSYRFVRHNWEMKQLNATGKWKTVQHWFPLSIWLDLYTTRPRKTVKFKLLNESENKLSFICTEIEKAR